MKEVEAKYRSEVTDLVEKYCKMIQDREFLKLICFKEIEVSIQKLKSICFRKINEFFREQYQLMKINKIMKEETESSGKNRNQSSSNSEEFDSNSGSGNGNGNRNNGGKSDAMSETLKKTKKLAKYASNILKEWFNDHLEDPYPSKEEKIMLASKTNLTMRQVNPLKYFPFLQFLRSLTGLSTTEGGSGRRRRTGRGLVTRLRAN